MKINGLVLNPNQHKHCLYSIIHKWPDSFCLDRCSISLFPLEVYFCTAVIHGKLYLLFN